MSTDDLAPTASRQRRASPATAASASAEEVPLASDIARRIETDMLDGRLRPGQRLDERELSARYGVSRTPVREALQRLSATGLAASRGRQGLQVAQLSVADLLDAMSVVTSLEALAALQAARRISRDQREALQKAHAACGEAIGNGDHDAFYQANIVFHDTIAAASHNRILQAELRSLFVKTAPYRRAITFQPGRMAYSQPEHEAVLEAILRNDPAGASASMSSHLSLLQEGIADLLHFVRTSEHAGIFRDEI